MMHKGASSILILLLFPFLLSAQATIYEELKNIKGVTVIQKDHNSFQEFYEIMVDQPLDHFNISSKKFKQRILIGINDRSDPTVMETEGYAIGQVTKPDFIKDCNLVSVEHRFYGRSLPDSLDWKYLTIKQAAYDCHRIKELLSPLLKGKWMTTGISKGGQTAVAYKMYFPDDAAATLAFVTPIKNSMNDPRIAGYFRSLNNSACGQEVLEFQKYVLRNKSTLLVEFNKITKKENLDFGKMSNETVFEYLVLEYPFAFFQNCFECTLIPDTSSLPNVIVNEIMLVVPPKFYTENWRKRLEPSFYMFYHELRYYEYDISSVKKYLQNSNYPNNIFAPQNIKLDFDTTYLSELNKFLRGPLAEKIIFIYGEYDPYTSLQAVDNKNYLKLTVKSGCHKSRVADLTPDQRAQVFTKLSEWLEWKVGN